jgi:hypothetical protein
VKEISKLISHICAQDNPHSIPKRVHQDRFSVSAWAEIVGITVVTQYANWQAEISAIERFFCKMLHWGYQNTFLCL